MATVSAEFPTEDLDAFVHSLQNQLDTLKRAFSSKIHVLETKCRELEAENKNLKKDKERLTEAAARAAQPSMGKSYTFQLPLDDDVADPFKSNTQKPAVTATSSSLQPTSAVFVPSKPVPPSTVHKPERGGAAHRGRGRGTGSGSRATSYTLVIPANLIKQQPITAPIAVPGSTSSTSSSSSSSSSSNGASKASSNGSPETGNVINGTTGPYTPAHKDSTGSSTARIEPLGTLSNNASFGSQNGTSAQQPGEQQAEDKQHPAIMQVGYRPTRGRHSYRGRGGRGSLAYQPWPASAVNA